VKVFVTGASGLIGSVLVPDLVSAGHEVLGLARSDVSAAAVGSAGAEVLRGDLDDLDALRAGAAASDAVVHLAFRHDFTDFGLAVRTDRAAIETFAEVLTGTGKALVIASGTPAVPGRVATEEDDTPPDSPLEGRMQNARRVLALAGDGVRSTVVRLPRTVHADGGRGGFAGALVQIARQRGVSGYVADGSARWPAVHVTDASRLFRLGVEELPAGTVVHAVADEGIAVRDIATAIGGGLGVPISEVAAEDLGFFGMLATIDQPASSTTTQERFGWKPVGPGLLENLRAGNYRD
jgi:nucleoside-diphosphate-sugar epimerase